MPVDSTDRPRSGRRRQQQSGLGLGVRSRWTPRGVGERSVCLHLELWGTQAPGLGGENAIHWGVGGEQERSQSRREEEESRRREEEKSRRGEERKRKRRRRTGRKGRKGEGEEKRSKGVRHSLGLGLQWLPELGQALHFGKACAHLGAPEGRRLLATPVLPAWEKLVAENSLPFPLLPFPPFLVLSHCGMCQELLLLPRPDG